MVGRKYHQSIYKPKNPEKYIGNTNLICCRSSWERRFCYFLDKNENVKFWNSEDVVIQYISPIDNKQHRYFIDFFVEFTSGKKILVEIKPDSQTKIPILDENKKLTKKKQFYFQKEIETFLVNQAKWKYAEDFASKRGMSFHVFTEKHLKELGIPI